MSEIERLVYTARDLEALGLRFSDPHLQRLIDSGAFPRPITPPGCRRMWRAADIHEWANGQRKPKRSPAPRRPQP